MQQTVVLVARNVLPSWRHLQWQPQHQYQQAVPAPGEPWPPGPYPGCRLKETRKTSGLIQHQHRYGQNNRQQRSHSSPPPHCPRQGYLSPQPVDAGGAASITGLLLGLNGAYAPVCVFIHAGSP